MTQVKLVLAAILVASEGAMPGTVPSTGCDPAGTLRVLFVGNSFTYVHNVPRLVEGIAASLPGPCIETSMIASGGATLEDHWRSDSVARLIRDGHWTHVVLNDQSTFGEGWWLEGKPRVGTSGRELMEFARRFAEVIRGAGAKPVLLAHWSDAHAPARDQRALDHLFAKVARATGSALSPAGTAIKHLQARLPGVTPYFTDNHHLSAIGAYLEALVVYSTLADRSPIGAARRVDGPAVEFNRGLVSPDSIVTLVDIADREAMAVQQIAGAIYSRNRRGIPVAAAPPPLSVEFPKVPNGGDPVNAGSLRGQWRGTSMFLPNPAGDSVAIEFSLSAVEGGVAGADSLQLTAGPVHMAGPAILRIEGSRAIVNAVVTPQAIRTGRPAPPLDVELQAALRNGVMRGVASIRQSIPGRMSSFNAVGQFVARRVGPSN